MAIATAYVRVVPDMRGIHKETKKGLKGVEGEFDATGKRSGGRFSSAFGSVAKAGVVAAGAAAAAAMGTALVKGFGRLEAIDNAEAKLLGLGHSAESVEKIMGNALASVKGTAFGLEEAATVAAGLVASGIKPGQELEQTLKTVADSATIAGIDMSEMGVIFGKVAAAGKLQGDELNQLAERGVPALQLLSEHLGVSVEETRKMVSAGEVSFQDFAAAMDAGMGGAALKSGETFTGAWKNVGAALGRIGATLLQPFFDLSVKGMGSLVTALDGADKALQPFMEKVGDALPGILQSAGDAIGRVVNFFRDWWPVLAVVTAGVLGYVAAMKAMLIIEVVRKALAAAAAAQWGLNAAMAANPVGLVVAAIAALVAGVVIAYTRFEWFRNVVDAVWAGIKTAVDAVVSWFMTYVWPTMSAVLNGMGAAFTWLWQNVISPAFNGIVAVIRWAINNVVIPLFNAYVAYLQTIVFPIFRFLYENVVKPVFAAIVMVISWAWAGIKVIWDAISWYIKNILSPIFSVLLGVVKFVWNAIVAVIRWAWNNIIKPIWDLITWYINNILAPVFRFLLTVVTAVWSLIRAAISAAWNWVKVNVFQQIVNWINHWLVPRFQHLQAVVESVWAQIRSSINSVWQFIKSKVFEPMAHAVKRTLPDAFESGKNAIGKAWDGLKAVAKKPVKFVIETVLNKGLISGFNKIAGHFPGTKEIPHINLPRGFRTGGKVWGAGTETSDSIPAMLSHNEHVLTARDVRNLGGHANVYRLRDMASRGLLPSFAGGGTLMDAADWWIAKGARASRHSRFNGGRRITSGHSRNSYHYCVPMDTMILTDRGTISYSDVRVGDKTLGFNTETGNSEWTTVREVVKFDDAELIRAKNSTINLRFTPNHRWIVDSRTTEWRGFKTYREDGLTGGPCPECGGDFPSLRGQSIHRNRAHGIKSTNAPSKRVKGSGGPVAIERRSRLVEFRDTRVADRIRLAAEISATARNELTVDEVRLLAWLMTDGTMLYGSSPRSDFHVDGAVYQKKPVYVTEIHELLERMGVEHTFHPVHNKDGVSSWTLRRGYLTALVTRAGLRGKDWAGFVRSLSTEQLKAFLDACQKAEGMSRTGGRQIAQSRAVNPGKSEAIALAAFLLGYSVNHGDEIVGLRRPHVQRGKLEVEPAGSESVWCVVTDLGTWTMVQNGQTVLTGNSDRAVDFNYGPGGQNATEMAFFDRWIGEFQRLFPGIRTIWRAPGHYNHLHIDTSKGANMGTAGGGGGFDLLEPFQELFGKLTDGLKGTGTFGDMVGAAGKKLIQMPIDWITSKLGEIVEGAGDIIDSAQARTIKEQVRPIAAGYGWGFGPEWNALDWLVSKESSWNPNAANPRSSARGLFQKMTSLHGPVEKTVVGQARWGLKYIKDTYGTPSAAKRHHMRKNWYADGGEVLPVRKYDTGGIIPPGLTTVLNATGRNEYAFRPDQIKAIAGSARAGLHVENLYAQDMGDAVRKLRVHEARREVLFAGVS